MDCQLARLLCPWILQARILEWVAMPFSKGSSWPREWTRISCVSCTAGGFLSAEPKGSPYWCICLYLSRTYLRFYINVMIRTSNWPSPNFLKLFFFFHFSLHTKMTVGKITTFHIFMIHIVNSIGFRYVVDKILVLKKIFIAMFSDCFLLWEIFF